MTEQVKLLSSVSAPLLKRSLLVATVMGGVAAVLLLFSGTWIPLVILSSYGLFLFILALILLAKGLIPYRKLIYMSTHPHELLIGPHSVGYVTKKRPCFTIPFSAINSITFVETKKTYGIAIFLKTNLEEKICVHNHHFSMHHFQKTSYREWGCHLFIPYFSAWSSNVLKEHLEASRENLT